MAKPTPIFCEACKDTGWILKPGSSIHRAGMANPCPHCDTGATKEKK